MTVDGCRFIFYIDMKGILILKVKEKKKMVWVRQIVSFLGFFMQP